MPFSDDLVLEPVSRWPTSLAPETVKAVLARPVESQAHVLVAADDRPDVSIVMVTFGGMVFTRLCIESLLADTSGITFEVIVVDNGSTDGTLKYLRDMAGRDSRLRVQANTHNAGFAAATNQGVSLAEGDVLVLLNNDTIVWDGWLTGIQRHLVDPGIGLLGAVTGRAGNEAEIDISYKTYGQFREFAKSYGRAHAGEVFDIRTVTMFCAAMRRAVWARVGPLDERFEVGLFEDDDYSMRVRQSGLRVVCAEDVFVHHFGQASIGKLGPTGEYGAIFHANRARWEAKWGVPWQPYARRMKPTYQDLVARIRDTVCKTLEADATIVVLSKGDPALLDFEGRRAWHFPHGEDGGYAGHHPANAEECIAGLEALRARGASHLVVPATMRWWLDYYAGFDQHLSARYRVMVDREACLILDLTGDVREA